MSRTLNGLLGHLRDPRWIPHISSYCDGRCDRCAFTERCWSYAVRQHASDDPQENASPHEAAALEVESGIPGDDVRPDESDIRAYEALQNRVDNDPLVIQARDFGSDVWKVMRPLLDTEDQRAEDAHVPAEALQEAWGLALVIGAKVHRAVGSFEHEKEENIEIDVGQNDANGSAKVARLAIMQSLLMWEGIQDARVIDSWLVEYLTASLKQIEAALTARFPFALAFVRPGFDEQIPGIVRPWSIMPEEEEDEE